MPQVSLYVDEPTMKTLRAEAAREGISLSKHVAACLRGRTRANTASGLPEGLLDSLYGCLADEDSFVRPEQIGYEYDAPRLAFD